MKVREKKKHLGLPHIRLNQTRSTINEPGMVRVRITLLSKTFTLISKTPGN